MKKLVDDELEQVSGGGGIDMGAMFRNATAGLEMDGKDLQARIDELSSKGEINQKDLLEMPFAMEQYNAKLEAM